MAATRQKFKDLAKKFIDATFNDFTHTYRIEALTKSPDGQGGYTEAWATYATITGFVFPVKPSEQIKDEAFRSKEPKYFQFEYIAGITSDMRILYNNQYYNLDPDLSIADKDIWIKVLGYLGDAT